MGKTLLEIKEDQADGTRSPDNSREFVEVLHLRGFAADNQGAHGPVRTPRLYLDPGRVPVRSKAIWLSQEFCDGHGSQVDAIAELENYLGGDASSPSKVPRLLGGKRRPSVFLIIASEYTAWMIKEILIRAIRGANKKEQNVPDRIIGLVFQQSSQPTDEAQHDIVKTLESIGVTSVKDIEDEFDKTFPKSNCMGRLRNATWMLQGDARAMDEMLPTLLQVCYSRYAALTNDSKGPSEMNGLRSRGSWSIGDEVKLQSMKPYLEGYSEQRSPSRPSDHQPSSMQADSDSWLHAGDLKNAMRILDSPAAKESATWDLKRARALALHQLGRHREAIKELDEILASAAKDPPRDHEDPDMLKTARSETLHLRASVLLSFGAYSKAFEIIQQEWASSEHDSYSIWQNPSSKQRSMRIRSINICRLRALVIAFCGFPFDFDGVSEDMLARAERECKSLKEFPLEKNEKISQSQRLEGIAVDISLQVARGRILMLQGSYEEAFFIVHKCLNHATRELGEGHFWSLEAAVLASSLMVKTSRVFRGRKLCRRALDNIEAQFGDTHLLALEAEYVMVSATQAEGLYTRALSKAEALGQKADESDELIDRHPFKLRCQRLLAVSHICVGNYLKAQRILEPAFEKAKEQLFNGERHPIAMRLQSGLALAQLYLGETGKARASVEMALGNQLKLYLDIDHGTIKRTEADSPGNCQMEQIVSVCSGRFLHPVEYVTGKRQMTHPDILSSFFTLCKIELSKTPPDRILVLEVLYMVHDSALKVLGPSHDLSLDSAIALGNVLASLQQDEDELGKLRLKKVDAGRDADEFFNFVSDQGSDDHGGDQPERHELGDDDPKRTSLMLGNDYAEIRNSRPEPHLGANHPTILRSIEAATSTKAFSLGEIENTMKNANGFKEVLRRILKEQGNKPGWNHPDRLRTMLSLLAMQIISNDDRETVLETLEDLIRRLEEVQDQRHLECLFMKDRATQLLLMNHDTFQARAKELLVSLKESVCQVKMDDRCATEALRLLEKRCEEGLKSLEQTRT